MPCPYHLTLLLVDPKLHRSAILSSKQVGFSGATVLYARGTVSNKLLCMLGMDHIRKEMMLFVGHKDLSQALHEKLAHELHLEKHGHGICFTLPLSRVLGLTGQTKECMKGETSMAYELITIIVDNGKADDIIDAATEAGASGATVLHGRGSGAEKVEKFFALEIEPEKEIVMLVTEQAKAEAIVAAIQEVNDFSRPNSGILFSMGLAHVSGLYRPS